ncbi:MAG: nucleotidyl transferase AbiEii/AbiGii toxin family protein, partial [Mogibacterium sp.]|nr:nucleotidyl transferase AbiEii/AbiGii toxin family protein [Mogibacterium sp.]
MVDLRDEINRIVDEGYNEANAEARLCQDIVLKAISESTLKRNVTIKGGVVMRNLSGSVRRATQDLDLDFIKYSVSDESIRNFISKLNGTENLMVQMCEPIKELNHQDYDGKRVLVKITDGTGYSINTKIDIGVHKDLDIRQEEYCFDICFQEDGASLLMNSKEQIITEKVKSLLRFGTTNTRYKDAFDIYYLKNTARADVIKQYIEKYIYGDETLNVNSANDVYNRLKNILTN